MEKSGKTDKFKLLQVFQLLHINLKKSIKKKTKICRKIKLENILKMLIFLEKTGKPENPENILNNLRHFNCDP